MENKSRTLTLKKYKKILLKEVNVLNKKIVRIDKQKSNLENKNNDYEI